jgi:hypothetical protein
VWARFPAAANRPPRNLRGGQKGRKQAKGLSSGLQLANKKSRGREVVLAEAHENTSLAKYRYPHLSSYVRVGQFNAPTPAKRMHPATDTIDTLRAALERLELWRHFEATATIEQRAMVMDLIRYADALLSRVVETFPTYTLHDRTHAVNVAHLMGRLVGPLQDRLTALEAALLLLSAFWHDIGMVYTEEERETVTQTEEFQSFLQKNPEAQLEFVGNEGMTRSTMEWFCRWNHAGRVFIHLNSVEDRRFEWNGVSLRQQLGDLCRSHNLPASELKRDDLCRTDFLERADVRFCAVLLRTADILDFDRSRSPEPVYRYIGVTRRSNKREKASDVEWQKHLHSSGFIFPEADERRFPYTLGFVAAPDVPAVEWDLRAFLDTIDGELLEAQQITKYCSSRWRDLVLPTRVLRNNIHGRNYKYGDYRFVLDQDEVLTLLMGDNLYANPFVFVRELLQNALDTSRHREFEEQIRGRLGYQVDPIVISDWYDAEQYHWVRIDDFGMGMTEEIIHKFLLRVGRSYYASAEFRANQLTHPISKEFVPISRFGIGLLSCFIAGDRVEISTRHALEASSASIRISLSGLHGFFTLQTGQHIPSPMPSARGDESGYRTLPGTSIAVRLDPRKEGTEFHLAELLNAYVRCPRVPILFDGEQIGGDAATVLDLPWLSTSLVIELQEDELLPAIAELGEDPATKIQIRVVPIDLSAHSETDHLRGQLVFAELEVTSARKELEKKYGYKRSYALILSTDNLIVECTLTSDWDMRRRRTTITKPDKEHLKRLEALSVSYSGVRLEVHRIWQDVPQKVRARIAALGGGIRISHNGISFPRHLDIRGQGMAKPIFPESSDRMQLTGIIGLQDKLRPDLPIARETLKALPSQVSLAIDLAFSRACRASGTLNPELGLSLLEEVVPTDTPLRDLVNEPALAPGGPWCEEPLFTVTDSDAALSAVEIATRYTAAFLPLYGQIGGFVTYQDFMGSRDLAARVLLRRNFACYLDFEGNFLVLQTRVELFPPITPGELLFPPLTFLPFMGSDELFHRGITFVNSNHKFARWLLEKAPYIHEHFPKIFLLIYRFVTRTRHHYGFDMSVHQLEQAIVRLRKANPDLIPPDLGTLPQAETMDWELWD